LRKEDAQAVASPSDRDRLLTNCEQAKRVLATAGVAPLIVDPYLGKLLSFDLSRKMLDALASPFVDKVVVALERALRSAHINPEALNRIFLTGGSSRLPALQLRLQNDERFASAFTPPLEPEWDVALGAAYAAKHGGDYCTVQNIGLILSDDSFFTLAAAGARAGSFSGNQGVSLVEDSPSANLVIATQEGHDEPERAEYLQVPTLGFDAEEIILKYELTQDLTFRTVAENARIHAGGIRTCEVGKLRFTYRIRE
jgi:molecular chaperone DnaK (HSP70)